MNRSIFKLMAMLFVALAGAGFTACSDDDDDSIRPDDSSTIVGLWQSVELKAWIEEEDGPFDQAAWDGMPMQPNEKTRIEFTADGVTRQWIRHGDSWSIMLQDGTYVVNDAGTAFDLTIGDETVHYTIYSLTDEEMVLGSHQVDIIDGAEEHFYDKGRFRRIPDDTPAIPGVG